MFTTLTQLSYENWLIENPDVKAQEEDCEECDGSGITHCFHCGNETDCEECDGTGKVNSTKRAYEEQKERDAKLLSRYLASIGAAAQPIVVADATGSAINDRF